MKICVIQCNTTINHEVGLNTGYTLLKHSGVYICFDTEDGYYLSDNECSPILKNPLLSKLWNEIKLKIFFNYYIFSRFIYNIKNKILRKKRRKIYES